MQTTAGSHALFGSIVPRAAFVVDKLLKQGAIILGKTNLSEWAYFRGASSKITSGWSGRGGQCTNPYLKDGEPWGSSSGSAVAVAVGLAAAAIGTETDGSIICPAGICNVIGIKPTVGLTSRTGGDLFFLLRDPRTIRNLISSCSHPNCGERRHSWTDLSNSKGCSYRISGHLWYRYIRSVYITSTSDTTQLRGVTKEGRTSRCTIRSSSRTFQETGYFHG